MPAAEPLDLLIVGAGFGGLYMLHHARQRGLSAQVVEAAPSVGGTWWHNRYPGARVDIPSLEYSFGFDEALQQQWRWSERYSAQPDLLAYANHVADRFSLRDGIALNTRIAWAHFDDAQALWNAGCADGRLWQARHIVMATGPLSAPNVPDFEGLSDFGGPVLHTANWPLEPVDFTGARVGVIGTGSSAVQAIPLIAAQAARLSVFQRTAAYAVPARNGPLDAALEAQVKADYAGFRERNRATRVGFGSLLPPNPASALQATEEERQARFEERWQIGGFAFLAAFGDLMTDLRANALAAEFVRSKIRETVRDAATAEALCPTQPIGCKRLCVDTGYYETYNRPNVQLLDVKADPIRRIVPGGVELASGRVPLDTLVLATGFDAVSGTLMRMDLRGRGGLRIQHAWRDGAVNTLGLMVAGFPNLYNIAGAGSTSAFTNVMVVIEHHVQWIAQCVADLKAAGLRSIEPTEAAQAEWMDRVDAAARPTIFLSCDSWYLGANIPGKPRRFMPYAAGFPQYVRQCAEVASSGYPGFRRVGRLT